MTERRHIVHLDEEEFKALITLIGQEGPLGRVARRLTVRSVCDTHREALFEAGLLEGTAGWSRVYGQVHTCGPCREALRYAARPRPWA